MLTIHLSPSATAPQALRLAGPPKALARVKRQLMTPAGKRWNLAAAPSGVQPGAEMLEAQDAGGSTKVVGDSEFQRNETVPSNSPGDQVSLAGSSLLLI